MKRKIISIFISVIMLTALFQSIALAEDTDTFTYQDYEYEINDENELIITKYIGSGGDVIIPNTIDGYHVSHIGETAFYSCSNITSITISDGIKSIGNNAIYGCEKLTKIKIPNSVTSIDTFLYTYCSSLKSIEVSNGNEFFSSYNGVMFNKDKTELVIYPMGKKDTTYNIPNSVKSIRKWAFYHCDNLTKVTIPNSVTSIGEGAFYICRNITNITIPNSVTSLEKDAFNFCEKLTSATISNSVTSLEKSIFERCKSLTSITIPNGVTNIGVSVFSGCSSLTSITIPNGVTNIGASAFSSCSSLTSITIPDSVTNIGDYAFSACSSLTKITIPKNVTSIEDAVFYGCNKLSNIKIPENVTSIGSSAFTNCSSLTKITILEHVTYIGKNAFDKNTTTLYLEKDSYAETYAKNNNLKYEYIDTNTSSKFTIGKDNNSFGHTDNKEMMKNAGFVGIKDFTLDENYFNKLVKYSSNGEKSYIKKMMKFQDPGTGLLYDFAGLLATIMKPFGLYTAWNGECYGIATAMGMNYEGYINLNDLSDSKVSNFYSLGYPYNDNKLKNVIHYFYLSQYLEKGGKEYASLAMTNSTNYTDNSMELSEFLKKIVEVSKNGHVTVFGYEKNEGGHVILLTGYEDVGENEPYKIRFFDENSVRTYTKEYVEKCKNNGEIKKNSNGEFSYMTISKDFSNFELKEYDGETVLTNSNYQVMELLDYSKMKKLDGSVDKSTKNSNSNSEVKVTIQVPEKKDLTIVNSEGKTLYYDGEKFTGSMDIYSVNRVQNAAIGNSEKSKMALIKVAPSDSFSITGNSSIYVDVYDENDYISLMANNLTSANLSLKNGINLEGNNYSFEAFVSTNEDVAENEKNLISIVANGNGNTKISKNDKKIIIDSKEGLKNTFISNYVGTKSATEQYDTVVKKATVGNILKEHVHNYKTTVKKATCSSKGKIDYVCKICGHSKVTEINNIKTIKLSKTKFTYNKKVQKPTVIIKDSKGTTLKEGTDYTVTYSNKKSKNVGQYQVTITFKGNYNGTKKLNYTINPKGTSLKKLKKGKKTFKVTWKAQKTQTTGYQIQYSTNKKFKSGNKKVKIKKNKITSKTVKKLKGKKKYYVRIRTYKIVNGKTYYSGWSKVKNVTTKK